MLGSLTLVPGEPVTKYHQTNMFSMLILVTRHEMKLISDVLTLRYTGIL